MVNVPVPGFPDLTRPARHAMRPALERLLSTAYGNVLELSSQPHAELLPADVESVTVVGQRVRPPAVAVDSISAAERLGPFDTVVSVLRTTTVDDIDRYAARLARLVADDGQVLFAEPTRTPGLVGQVQRLWRPATEVSARLRLHTGFRIALWRAGLSVTDVTRHELPRLAWPLTTVSIGVATPTPTGPDGSRARSMGPG